MVLAKTDRIGIRCKESTRTRFKEVCGHFPTAEAALIYMMSRFDPEACKMGRGNLL